MIDSATTVDLRWNVPEGVQCELAPQMISVATTVSTASVNLVL